MALISSSCLRRLSVFYLFCRAALQVCRTLPRHPLRAARQSVCLPAMCPRQSVYTQTSRLHVQLLTGQRWSRVKAHTQRNTHALAFFMYSLPTCRSFQSVEIVCGVKLPSKAVCVVKLWLVWFHWRLLVLNINPKAVFKAFTEDSNNGMNQRIRDIKSAYQTKLNVTNTLKHYLILLYIFIIIFNVSVTLASGSMWLVFCRLSLWETIVHNNLHLFPSSDHVF